MAGHALEHPVEHPIATVMLRTEGIDPVRLLAAPGAGMEAKRRPCQRPQLLDRLRNPRHDLVAPREPERFVTAERLMVPAIGKPPEPVALLELVPLGDVRPFQRDIRQAPL